MICVFGVLYSADVVLQTPTFSPFFDTLGSIYCISELDADPQCCALADLGDRLTLIPRVFYPKIRKGRVVVATSPDKNHWSSFAHEHLARMYADMVMGAIIYLQVSETWWPLFVACS
jgi:hypothetical protein